MIPVVFLTEELVEEVTGDLDLAQLEVDLAMLSKRVSRCFARKLTGM